MDELIQYLKSLMYNEFELKQILNKKIIITRNHIEHINLYYYGIYWRFNIIALFEIYGYIFTDDDCILLINKDISIMQYIPDNNKTYELCENAVRYSGTTLQYVPDSKKTKKICKIAVRQYGYLLRHVPKDKKTNEICEIAVRQNGNALQFVPEDKKTDELCKIAVQQTGTALQFVPKNKKTDELCEIAVQRTKTALQLNYMKLQFNKLKLHYD